VRALHEIYHPETALEALALLSRDEPHATLVMVGPDKGGYSQRLLDKARLLGIGSRVTITGSRPKDEIPSILNAADIFINTSIVDNTPVTLIEAAACGLCIVSTNVGGIPDLMRHGLDALLVPPRDPHALAASVLSVLRNQELSEQLSTAARSVAAKFDWALVGDTWHRLFTSVVDDSPR